jgi:UDP-glucuronate 4-epimerase
MNTGLVVDVRQYCGGLVSEWSRGGMLKNQKILVSGPTGQVGRPVAKALAADNVVWGVARFADPAVRQDLESAGVRCVPLDLADGRFDGLPDDFTHVVNMAVVKSGDFERDLAVNCEALGLLMAHCRGANAFLHCSSTAVYQPNGHHRFAEGDPLGDNHRVFMPTYSISKIAAEVVARTGARQWGLPTTIARLNVPYGDNGGWPSFHLDWMLAGQPIMVHTNKPSLYNPIHEEDIIEKIPRLLEVAGVPATTVNWAGREAVSIEEWCGFMGELAGLEPQFAYTDQTLESVTTDNSLMHRLVGETSVAWREGMRRMVAVRHPELGVTADL